MDSRDDDYSGTGDWGNCAPQKFCSGDPVEQNCGFAERRKKARVNIPFLAKVQGISADGQAFETYTFLENLSSSGLYMNLRYMMKPGDSLSAILNLVTCFTDEGPHVRVAVFGVVQRVEDAPYGLFGTAVKFTT